ncbi:formamidase [Rhodococcus sp. H36-A4]|uniref:formamidase n=1 Tax=Rhodococcus sp. H36-A4 TaxID=3004353 RepID=UPI0022B01183|nr:formamidase [Rhodococcus sp. H36-A4]MCZ4080443.1 formamidase [Rhodococcus sp. H36-A4]
MTGLGGLNPSSTSLTLGLVQQRVPLIGDMADVDATTDRVCRTVREAKAGLGSLDLLVFPEYSLHGLRKSSWARDDVMCDIDGPQVARLREACRESKVWGCFSVMERNPNGAPFNSGIIVDTDGEITLYVRKLHPWTPKEPWEPGDLGVPVCAGPKGSVLSLLICHDGMFPEMAREASYRGANVLLRTAGYKFPLKQSWRITNEANAFQNLAYTASVCLAGHDGNGIPSMGEAMVCDFEGTIIERGDSTPDRVVTVSIEPARADAARREWGVENNIYQLGHRGYTALEGGATDCPYTFMRDLVAGTYRVPWEDDVQIFDGTTEGYGAPRDPASSIDSARGGLRGK